MSSEPQCGEIGGCGVSANEYSCAHGAQINFRDLTPYLTYGEKSRLFSVFEFVKTSGNVNFSKESGV
jgi:hypothetical protein